MPPKNAPNGFYMYMQEQRKIFQAQTKRMTSVKEMVSLCTDSWRSLNESERAKYVMMAKQEKQRLKSNPDRDRYRMDNQRQIIAEHVDIAEEDKKRRHQESQTLIKSWIGQDVKNILFYLIDFQVMYIDQLEDDYLPLEIGMTCFSLKDGVQKSLHYFIDPGEVPQGNRHLAQVHSEKTHQIPLHFEQADSNFLGLWMEIVAFLVDSQNAEIPPFFCLSTSRKIVESCLAFIHYQAKTREPNRLIKIYCIEDLVNALMMQSGKLNRNPAENQVYDALRQNRWDYTSSIRCPYHEDADCAFCSLSIVKRYSFTLFDLLANLLDFKLTSKHMPDETKQLFVVSNPTSIHQSRHWGNSGADYNREKGNTSRSSSVRSVSPPTFIQQSPKEFTSEYKKNKTVIKLDEDENDDSYEEEDSSEQEESKLRTGHYPLKEVRKPQKASFSVGFQDHWLSLGHGVTAQTIQTSSARPRRTESVGSNPWGKTVTVPSPPGLSPSSEFDAWPMLVAPSSIKVNPMSASGVATGPAVPVLWGRGRGRGLPPQDKTF